jgi:hypothetical protein
MQFLKTVKAVPVQVAPVKKVAKDKKSTTKKGYMARKKVHKPGKQTLKGKSLKRVGGKKSTLKFFIDCAVEWAYG